MSVQSGAALSADPGESLDASLADAPSRAEEREEFKLRLEKWKFGVSLLGIVAIVFAGLQWRGQSEIALQTVYQRITAVWSDHVGLLVNKPKLRPYFTLNAALPEGDRQEVLAFADSRLEAMDAILTFAYMSHGLEEIGGWKRTFKTSFRDSTVLCERYREVQENYGMFLKDVSVAAGCTSRPDAEPDDIKRPRARSENTRPGRGH